MTNSKTVTAFAPAKVNLTLHVTGQRDDGYHLLDSLVVFAGVGDELAMCQSDHTQLSVTGSMAQGVPTGNENMVVSAAHLLHKTAEINLTKNLPSAAGIGGGSSDAAATIRGLSELYDCALPDAETLVLLGADVPVCLTPNAQRMRGIGAVVEPVNGLPDLWAVLLNPGFPIATGKIFKALTTKNNAPMPTSIPRFNNPDEFCAWLYWQRNDLEPVALAIEPRLAQVFDALSETQPLLSRMSGSGATCFGLYRDADDAAWAQTIIRKARPTWWVQSTKLS